MLILKELALPESSQQEMQPIHQSPSGHHAWSTKPTKRQKLSCSPCKQRRMAILNTEEGGVVNCPAAIAPTNEWIGDFINFKDVDLEDFQPPPSACPIS